jgi:hypothetical protein
MLYVAWAVIVWLTVIAITANEDSYPSEGSMALLALTSALLAAFGVRAWRLGFEIWPHHVLVRNLFRSYSIPVSDLRSATFDGSSAIAPGIPGQAVEVECLRLELRRSPFSVDVVATMWLPAREKRALLRRLKRTIKNH